MAEERLLQGARVLLVEDDTLVATVIEDLLTTHGCTVIGPFACVSDAVAGVANEILDVALIDVNLAGTRSYPVADAAACRNLPFVLMTGYGETGLPAQYANRPFVVKPFKAPILLDTLSRALERQHAT